MSIWIIGAGCVCTAGLAVNIGFAAVRLAGTLPVSRRGSGNGGEWCYLAATRLSVPHHMVVIRRRRYLPFIQRVRMVKRRWRHVAL